MAHHFVARLVPLKFAALVMLSVLLCACNQPAGEAQNPESPIPPESPTIINTLRTLTDAQNRNTLIYSDALLMAVNQFLASPSEETRTAFQQAWLKAHEAFASTRALIMDEENDELLFRIDAWPIQPGFLDSLPGYPDSGIINDFAIAISPETLRRQHGITDSEEVSLGFHPLEYYAFARPISDFVVTQGDSAAEESIERRRKAVKLIAEDLNASLNQLTARMSVEVSNLELTPGDGPANDHLVLYVLSGTRRTAHHGFRQANLVVDKDQGHCEFSQSSLASLGHEMRTVRTIFAKSGPLMERLYALDERTARNLDTTLNQAVNVLSSDPVPETERAKLPLMLSAVNHQLEEFEQDLGATP
jgi:hypothetical protein